MERVMDLRFYEGLHKFLLGQLEDLNAQIAKQQLRKPP